MILERLSRAFRQQNWFAVAIETLIVIVGVVVGFQITAWGNARAERAEEQELLRGLQGEFTEVLADLDLQVAKHRRVERAVVTTLEKLAEAERSGATRATVADTTLAWALVPTTTQFSQGVLDGLLTTGRLGLIRNSDLRKALSEWEGVLADVTEDEVASRAIVTDQLEPMLWRRMDVRALRTYELLEGTLPPAAIAATSAVPVDTELIGVLTTRRYWLRHTILEFSGPQEEARRILDLVGRSLEER